MTRPIKFRAWDNYKKKMFAPSHIDSFGAVVIQEAHEEGCRHCGGTIRGTHPIDLDATLMQFTGLTDKNGKEIYEGDICKYERIVDFGNYESIVSVVKYVNAAFILNDDLDTELGANYIHDVEVIGNIYENPELLK